MKERDYNEKLCATTTAVSDGGSLCQGVRSRRPALTATIQFRIYFVRKNKNCLQAFHMQYIAANKRIESLTKEYKRDVQKMICRSIY